MLLNALPRPAVCSLFQLGGEDSPLGIPHTSHPYYESSTINSIISQWVDIPAALSPSFRTQWQTITRDGFMTEGSPWDACITGSWPKQLSQSHLSVYPRVSQFAHVAEVTGSWRSRGKQTGILHTSSILLAREDHMASFSSPVWWWEMQEWVVFHRGLQRECSPVRGLGEVLTFIGSTI